MCHERQVEEMKKSHQAGEEILKEKEKAIKHVHVFCTSTEKENVTAQKTVAKVEALRKIEEKDKMIKQLEEKSIEREEKMDGKHAC